MTLADEEKRIRAAYARRKAASLSRLYDWQAPEVQLREYGLRTAWSGVLADAGIHDLSDLDILDVGCGTGGWLRQLMAWGAVPDRLHGIDLLEERVAQAKRLAPHIDIRVASAWPIPYPDAAFDVVFSHTVFSSILDRDGRSRLAQEMMRVLRPDGIILIYDFRYNNPRNSDVTGITVREIRELFPNSVIKVRTLTLVPPLARRLVPASPLLGLVLERLCPFLRSHALYRVGRRNPA